jgi:hypothetical protein
MPVGEMFSCDNSGNRCGPHPDISDPVLGTGQNVSAAAKDTNEEVTVVAGAMYAITCIKGAHIFGIATTDTATNVVWACGSGHTIVLRVPFGYTSLHFQTPDSSRRFILRRLAD